MTAESMQLLKYAIDIEYFHRIPYFIVRGNSVEIAYRWDSPDAENAYLCNLQFAIDARKRELERTHSE